MDILGGIWELLEDVPYFLRNLPAILSQRRKIKKLRRYFAENLPDRFTSSPQYAADIVWDMGKFIGVFTLDVTEEGVDYAQVDFEALRAQAKEAAAETVSSVSHPPLPHRHLFCGAEPQSAPFHQRRDAAGRGGAAAYGLFLRKDGLNRRAGIASRIFCLARQKTAGILTDFKVF